MAAFNPIVYDAGFELKAIHVNGTTYEATFDADGVKLFKNGSLVWSK